MSIYEMPVVEMSIDEMPVHKMTADKMTSCLQSLQNATMSIKELPSMFFVHSDTLNGKYTGYDVIKETDKLCWQ